MTTIYLKLIAMGLYTIATVAQRVPAKAVEVATAGIIAGTVLYDDVPQEFKQDVKDSLAAAGYDENGEILVQQ